MLVREFELGTLWDKYSIIGDIIVSNILPCLYIINIYLWTHFSAIHECLSQANIHELLSPDLLHQLIKGVFKEYIVTWITDYIKAKYPEQEANRILDDIDCW